MKQKKEYSNKLITFDIETTTFEYEDEHYTDVYLASFLEFRFDINNQKEDFEKIYNNPLFFRNWYEINEEFISINKKAKKEDKYQVIYVHNLAYEFDGLIKNCSFVQQNFNNKDSLFIKSRKLCYARLDHVEIRCSYILINKSLKSLGIEYNYPKLDIDYNAQYFSFSTLPDVEYDYNKRDVQLQALAICKECSKFPFISQVKDIPYTMTSFTRKNNQYINSKQDARNYVRRNVSQRNYPKKYIGYQEQVYTGGYVHTNPLYAFRIVQKVVSADIVSSYPASMLQHYYPYNFHKAICRDVRAWFKYMLKMNERTYAEVLENFIQPFSYAFMATVKIKNVKLKQFNNTVIPVISSSKCLNEDVMAILDNGRVDRAREIEIAVTEIDYWLMLQFYEFELVDVTECFYTCQFRPLADYVLNCVKSYLDEKTVLKECCKKYKKLQKKHFRSKFDKNKFILSDESMDSIISLDPEDREQELRNLLTGAKQKLNSQYGINVQKLFAIGYNYIPDTDEYEKVIDYNLPKSLYRNFQEGMYITAYSRLNLFTFALYVLNNSTCDLIYSDTDSWKITNEEEAIGMITEYNEQLEKVCHNSEMFNLGYFDYEETYDYFIAGGAKKYITCTDGKVSATIAGVPKKAASDALTDLYKNECFESFETLCKIAFKPNTVYSYSMIQKLSTKYKQLRFEGLVRDTNGISGRIEFNSMVELCETDYFFLDYTNFINKNYVIYLEEKQQRSIDRDLTYIYVEDGKTKYKYIKYFKHDIKFVNDVISDNYIPLKELDRKE